MQTAAVLIGVYLWVLQFASLGVDRSTGRLLLMCAFRDADRGTGVVCLMAFSVRGALSFFGTELYVPGSAVQ